MKSHSAILLRSYDEQKSTTRHSHLNFVVSGEPLGTRISWQGDHSITHSNRFKTIHVVFLSEKKSSHSFEIFKNDRTICKLIWLDKNEITNVDVLTGSS